MLKSCAVTMGKFRTGEGRAPGFLDWDGMGGEGWPGHGGIPVSLRGLRHWRCLGLGEAFGN